MTFVWGEVWTHADGWDWIGLISLFIAVACQTRFVYRYARRRFWYKYFVGKALMLKSAVIGVSLWIVLFNTFVIYPWQRQIGDLLLLAIAVGVVYQLAALEKSPPLMPPPGSTLTPDGELPRVPSGDAPEA